MNAASDIRVEDLLEKMTDALREQLGNAPSPVTMVGIHTGGLWVAEQLHRRLGLELPLASMDISFYRDDVGRSGLHPQTRPSKLPLSVEGHRVVLVDDVLYTGRTIRAALNELFDYGRPQRVYLAVLVDREERELPICADVVGQVLRVPRGRHIKLSGPEPLLLSEEDET